MDKEMLQAQKKISKNFLIVVIRLSFNVVYTLLYVGFLVLL